MIVKYKVWFYNFKIFITEFFQNTLYRQGSTSYLKHHYYSLNPCRVRGKDTKSAIFEIARFFKASDGFQFVKNGPDFRNKKPIIELEIGISVRISCKW